MTATATLPRTRLPAPLAALAGVALRAAPRRRWDDAHPGWWLWAGAGLAWVVLGGAALAGGGHHAAPAHHHTGGMAAMGHGVGAGAPDPAVLNGRWALHWAVMVVAMMWPLVALQAAAVRRRTRPPWRLPAVGAFVAAYTAGWLVVGLAARAATAVLLPAGLDRAWLVGWLAVAAAAAASTWRIRTLRACGRLRTIAPAGRRSLATAARAGLRAWRPCAVLCGPVMAAMVVAHPLWLLAVVSGVVWFEQRHALAWRHPLPPVVLGLAAGAALLVP